MCAVLSPSEIMTSLLWCVLNLADYIFCLVFFKVDDDAVF